MDAAYYTQMAEVEDRHWWFAARRAILAAVLDALPLPAGADVMEVGCGTGGNLALLARYGRLVACEPDEAAVALAAARGVAPVERGALPDRLPFADRRFDLMALLDVLEHVEADRESLAVLRERLKPGGFLLLTVPAYMWLWSGHDEVNHHVRRYTRRELVAKVRAAGLAVHHATYFNTWLLPPIAAVRVLSRWLGRGGSDLALPPEWLNRRLERIMASERHRVASGRLPAGVSVLLVARREGD